MTLPTYDFTQTLLEDVYQPLQFPFPPVVVFDFKVYAHAINKYAENASEVAKTEEELKTIMKAMWAYKLNRGPDMLPQFPFVGVVVDDLKGTFSEDFSEASTTGQGYWRHIEAHKLDLPEYKGGRGEKTPLFHITEAAGYEYIFSKGCTFSFFSKEFYEADDLAGLVSRLKRNADPQSPLGQRQIILSTVDGDWQGLVSDSYDIVWANTGPWLPRLRSEREVCDYYLRKDKLIIESAKGCYTVKEQVGDSGDNLLPGTPLRFFDLFEEDKEWKFSEAETSNILKALNSTSVSNRLDHMESARKFITSKGLFLPEIPPTTEYEKTYFFNKAIRIRKENSSPQLKGKNKTLCLNEVADEDFEKCKKFALQDAETHQQIKNETLRLEECKNNSDEKCIKDLKAIIKVLKDLRKSIKDQLSQLVSNP